MTDCNLTDMEDIFNLLGTYDSSFFKAQDPLTADDLTERAIGGNGMFDALMESVKVHLKEEYDKNRISGAEYTKAYIALTQSALSSSVQYLLQKDQSHWTSVNAQLKAMADKITIRKVAYEYQRILPKQDALIKAQIDKERAATKEKGLDWVSADCVQDTATESTENIAGVIGLQKLLYVQQEKTYKQDTINNTMQHLYSAWSAGITNGTSGISAPTALGTADFNTSVTNQLDALKLNSNFG